MDSKLENRHWKKSQCSWKVMNYLADLGFRVRKSLSNGVCPVHF